jgi:ABC-type glycerol-3-phosphate transport system substrate-binding protein
MRVNKLLEVSVLSCALAVIVSGCGKTDSNKIDSGGAPEVEQVNDSLTLSLPGVFVIQYEDVIKEYKEKYPKVKFELVTYPYEEMEAVKALRKKRAADLMAGNGYDLYVMADIEFNDLQKVEQAGAFEDMLPYLEKDTEIKREDYLDCIFQMGKDKDKCYVLPYRTAISLLLTKRSILEETGIDLENCTNYEEQFACVKKYKELYPDRSACTTPGYDSLWSLGFTPWESEKNAEILDSDLLREIETQAKKEYSDEQKSLEELMQAREDFLVKGENLYIYGLGYPDFKTLCKLGGQKDGVMVPRLQMDGKPYMTTSGYSAAIASGSSNKQNAWNFIKLLLSEKYQRTNGKADFSVKKSILDEWFDEQEKLYGTETVMLSDGIYPGVSKEQIEKAKEQVYESRMQMPMGYVLGNKYVECIQHFYKGEKSYEDSIEEFREYMEIYYSE